MTGELKIKIGKKEISLNLAGIDEAAQKSIIESSVAAFMKSLEPPRPVRTYRLKERPQPVDSKKFVDESDKIFIDGKAAPLGTIKADKMPDRAKEEAEKKTDPDPDNGDERRLTVPLGEKISRLQGYEKTYQAYYVCTNKRCKNRGKHYITKSYIEIHCHKCSTKMKVKKAVEGPDFKPDGFGNYFVAGDFIREVNFDILKESQAEAAAASEK